MTRVIVADDEYFARKALVKALESMEMPIEVCGDCENGQDVVELLQRVPADLIITDIRMPEMDGLRLAEYVKENKLNTDIIIETGYAEFDYARTAIRYGVKEYLIKPLNTKELRSSVQRVMEDRQRKNREELVRLLDLATVLRNPELRRQVFVPEDIPEQTNYCMILSNGENEAWNARFFKEWLSKHTGFRNIQHCFFAGQKEYVLLVHSNASQEEPPDHVFGEAVKAELEPCIPQNVWVGFSQWHQGELELEQAYRECIDAMNERILKKGRIFFCRQKSEFREIVTKEQERRFYDAVERRAEPDAEAILDEVFTQAQRGENDVYDFFAALMRIFLVLNQIYYQGSDTERRQAAFRKNSLVDFKMDLYQFTNLDSVRQYIHMLITEICQKNPKEENDSMIQNLVEYLEIHYSYDISLTDLAEQKYFVSASYLSRLFKAHTGQKFSKYLMELRMKKAKNLLECSRMDISSIAACTGYNDASHFTQTFRKVYGVSPKEYRRRLRET